MGNPPVRTSQVPEFALLDEALPPQVLTAMGGAQREWSNPQYFMEIWLQEQQARLDKRKIEKQRRREAKRLKEKTMEGRGGGATRVAAISAIKGGQIKSWQERHDVAHLVSPRSSAQRRASAGAQRIMQTDDPFKHVVRFSQNPSPTSDSKHRARSPEGSLRERNIMALSDLPKRMTAPVFSPHPEMASLSVLVPAIGADRATNDDTSGARAQSQSTASLSAQKMPLPMVSSLSSGSAEAETRTRSMPPPPQPTPTRATGKPEVTAVASESVRSKVANMGVRSQPSQSAPTAAPPVRTGSVRKLGAGLGAFFASKSNPAPRVRSAHASGANISTASPTVTPRRSVANSAAANVLELAFAQTPAVGPKPQSSGGSTDDYAPFQRMLKMHVPEGAVRAKLSAAGLDPNVLFGADVVDEGPTSQATLSSGFESTHGTIRVEYAPFQRMLKMHVPEGAVVLKVQAAGLNPDVLFGRNGGGALPQFLEDPLLDSAVNSIGDVSSEYAPFQRMLRMHVPAGAVALKVQAAGLDASALGLVGGSTGGTGAPSLRSGGGGGKGFLGDIQAGVAVLRKQTALPVPSFNAIEATPAAEGLMAEIIAKKGGGLRTVAADQKVSAVRQDENPLIAAIRKGKTLRKVEVPEKRPSKPGGMTGGFSDELVQKMLERRGAVEESSDSGDSDDEAGAWD